MICRVIDRTSSSGTGPARCDRPCRTIDQAHDERAHAVRLFEAIDLGDVGTVDRGEQLRLTLEARRPIGILVKGVGQKLDGDLSARWYRGRDILNRHAAGADSGSDVLAEPIASR